MSTHSGYPDIAKRLKRAHGHLNSILTMLEEDRECLEVAQQLQAVEKAIISAKKILVHNHIDHCLEQALDSKTRRTGATIQEFKEITKYL